MTIEGINTNPASGNVRVVVLNPMEHGVTPLNLRGWLRQTISAHDQSGGGKNALGFLFMTQDFAGRVTRKQLVKILDSAVRRSSIVSNIAVVAVPEVITDDRAEEVVGRFLKTGKIEVDL